jgi:hypothetical protein
MRRKEAKPYDRSPPNDRTSHILLALLLCFAFVIRLHYFQEATAQPLWWDEAEYLLKAKNLVFGTPETGFNRSRPLGFPLMLAAFYQLGLGETSMRVALVLASVATVYLTYRIGERLFGTLAACVGTGLFAMFVTPIFYTSRVLTEIPRLLLGLLAVHLYLSNRSVLMWLAIPVLALATFTHLTAAIFVVVLGVHFVVVHGYGQLRKNAKLLTIVVVVLLVLLAWNGDALVSTFMSWRTMFPRELFSSKLLVRLNTCLAWLYFNLGLSFTVLLVAGTALLLDWLRKPRQLVRRDSPNLADKFLVFLWLSAMIAFFGAIVVGFHDRYLIVALPAVFLTIGLAAAELASRARRIHRLAPWLIVGAVLIAGGIQFLPETDKIFHSRVRSQEEVRDAAEWIKDRTSPEDTLMSLSMPQLTYYTERATSRLPEKRDDYEVALGRQKPRFVVLARYEKHPEWITAVTAESVGLRLVATFPQRSPMVFVLEPLESQDSRE